MSRPTRFKFTTRAIEQLPACPATLSAKALEFSDTEVAGFKVCVSKAGRKTFLLRYTYREMKRAVRIGEFPATSLVDARKIALEMRAQLDRDIDPQSGRDRDRASPLFSAFVAEYLAYARAHKRSWKDDVGRLRTILPRFGGHRLSEISRREIELFLMDVRKTHTPATTNRYLSLLSAIFKRAVLVECLERNPCAGVQRLTENNLRQRFLSNDEIGRLLTAMKLAPPEVRIAVAALKFLLLTGVRRREALHARWEHVDFERRVLFVPHSKSGRSKYVQLNDAAIALLADLPSRAGNGWIFPSRRDASKPLCDPRKTFWTLLDAAGISDRPRLHDLRHTFCSLAINAGQTLYVVQGLVGHASPQTTMRYAHIANGTLREASQAVADAVAKATLHT
ncbi:tyrosine-type recombinase/integrase [Aromatoleum evansii]|uniref:tyrosine-type recombinase/integrase n=1 Tax=Aromatoleum evansii TaxID=59406 RepID=UPI00145E9062|nr:site-specific integrase [Aromatoleum evansii]NMG32531.1 tyrosine-type recombinase/integrase [Aromatoleum evansii]